MPWAPPAPVVFTAPPTADDIVRAVNSNAAPIRQLSTDSATVTAAGLYYLAPGRKQLFAAFVRRDETETRRTALALERRERIRTGVLTAAAACGGQPVLDEELLDEVTALVEWPVPVTGRFEERFLDLPREVLISTLQDHQRYFPVEDANGRLLPWFITLSNIESRDPQVVRAGNERAHVHLDQLGHACDLGGGCRTLEVITHHLSTNRRVADKCQQVGRQPGPHLRNPERDPAERQAAGSLAAQFALHGSCGVEQPFRAASPIRPEQREGARPARRGSRSDQDAGNA